MQRNELSIGDRVIFGNPRGEKTLGEIVKLNPKKAKVKLLEDRGTKRVSRAGAIWTVPYGGISLAPEGRAPQEKVDPEVRYVRDYSRKTEQFKKGDKVWFVGKNSKKVGGTVIRVNKKSVAVKPNDGSSRYWRVPPSMLFREGEEMPEEKASKKRTEKEILSDLLDVECMLSPENLTCDGELPRYLVQRKERELRSKRRQLVKELGREPTDEEIWGPPFRKSS